MVKVGDTILINEEIKAIVTTLFQIEDSRWFIGYDDLKENSGFFIEGDEEFEVIKNEPYTKTSVSKNVNKFSPGNHVV